MEYTSVFQRIEMKYLINKQQYDALRTAIEPYMQEDEYGLTTISSIYFDTDKYDLVRYSLDKPIYKEKLRLRCYGSPNEDSSVFLELKKKYKGVVYKRRVAITYKEAKKYLMKGIRPNTNSQIMDEIDYFIKFYHPVAKSFIAYDRIALIGKQDSSLRMTFDHNIRTRFRNLELNSGTDGKRVLGEDEYLMEVKVADSLPLWLVHLLSELAIYPHSFSKYGSAYTDLVHE